MKLYLLGFLSFFMMLVYPAVAEAQRHAGYCDAADSTAETLDCVNRHYETAQEDLAVMYRDIIEQFAPEDEGRALLAGAQKEWVLYRDTHCAWEATLAEVPALKRVYELSCLTSLTESRQALLSAIQERETVDQPREFSAQPRWMNALSRDYPDIFWRYGDWLAGDFDCDGDDEHVMTGISVVETQDSIKVDEKDVKEQITRTINMVVAVSENPVTGRPKARLIRFPVTDEAEGVHVCRPGLGMKIVEMSTKYETGGDPEKAAVENTDALTCRRYLEITDRTCAPLKIRWDGEDYNIGFVETGRSKY